ncbi:MAG TPA: flagellar basal body L-ring protein FlgH [Stellaceae bacterium]
MNSRIVPPALVLLVLAGSVAACQHGPPPIEHDLMGKLDHLPGDKGEELPATNGAVYHGNVEGGGGIELFRDHPVWRVGDIVTVQVQQNATASKNVSQNIGRSDSSNYAITNLFGLKLAANKFSPAVAFNSSNTLQGSGGTAQSDAFVSTVSAMVRRVRPNGDLVIAGSDEVQLVGGREYIRIAGVVRAQDIQNNNIVNSTQMAEAHIEFSGDGETYLAPRMGTLQRFFMTVSTVWPGDWF